jgi:methylmalonyl-CoA mutase N-terminal domain/subunit
VFESASGIPLRALYTSDDVPAAWLDAQSSRPGRPPYLRGAYPEMYRSKPWRIFQLSGHGNPEDENARIRFLLEHGETGFLMEHDRMTADHLYNVDHPDVVARSHDVGLTGAVIQSIEDYHTVLDGIAIEETYAHPGGGVVQHAPFALACYWSVAKERGISLERLSGTGQADYFLTYVGCFVNQQIPPHAGLRLNGDIIEFCSAHLPKWVPVSIAGYNGADTGLNAYQEVAAVLANAIEYLDEIKRRGRLSPQEVAWGIGGISLRTSMDIFEDAAKLRVARKMWSDLLRERYGVTDERSLRLRVHVVTAGSAMTYQEPLNNIIRGTLMALSAVLGGTQSLGVSCYDEAISVPSEHAHLISLRVQQILQNETNVAAVVDPLGGSYYVETLSAELEERGREFLAAIEENGGFLETIRSGWLQRQALENQNRIQSQLESGDRTIVGVNAFREDTGIPAPFEVDAFEGSPDAFDRATKRLHELRATRDASAADRALKELRGACGDPSANVMPRMMDAVQARVTLGEIGEVFRESFGEWDMPDSLVVR